MKTKKKFFQVLVLALVLTLGVSLAACKKKQTAADDFCIYSAGGDLVFDETNHAVEVEYGSVYAFPLNAAIGGEKVTATLALYDASDNTLSLAYGSYTFRAVGEYRAVYSANGKTLTVNVSCRDTVAPVINVINYALYGVEGDEVSMPNCTFNDLAGIDETSISYVVTDPDGETVTVTDNKFTVSKIGNYRTTVSVRDRNGLSAERVLTTECLEKYIDTNKTDASVIYTFDNQNYLQLVRNVRSEDNITREIVTSGYPAIAGEASGNGVLKMTSDKVYGDVRTKFLLHEDLLASQGRNIVIRFAVDKDTDYIKLYKDASTMTDAGTVAQMFGIQAGQWYTLTVCPLAFGYHLNFKDFVLSYRDTGGVTMYIDYIAFDGEAYVDPSYETSGKTVLANFDSAAYGVNLYQNLYSQPTDNMGRVDGTEFELLPAGDAKIPAANAADSAAPGLGATSGVLHGKVTANYGGLTYMFPEPLDLDEVHSLHFRMRVDQYYSALVFAFFDGSGLDGTNQRWIDWGKPLYTPNEWRDYVFSNELLHKFAVDGKISGFYFYCRPHTSPNVPYPVDFWLDEVSVRYQNETSEQRGSAIADFETASLKNVHNNTRKDSATFAIQDSFGTDDTKVLAVTSAKSGDGFMYLFDEAVTLAEGENLRLDIGLGAATFNKVEVGIVYGSDTLGRVTDLDTAAHIGKMRSVILRREDVLAITAAGRVQGIYVATTAAAGSVLYVDNIGIYDSKADTDKPVVTEAADAKAYLPAGTEFDLAALTVTVTDASDPSPSYTVESISDPDGDPVTVIGNAFTPTKSGDYTVTVRGVDAAGNTSEQATELTVTVGLYDLENAGEKKEYYANQLQFDAVSGGLLTATSTGIARAAMVADADATGGSALEITYGYGADNAIRIDLGGLYTVDEISGITLRFKHFGLAANSCIWLNGNTTQNGDVSHIGWLNSLESAAGYTDLHIDRQTHILNRNIPASEQLDYLQIYSKTAGNSKIRIDSVTVHVIPPDTDAPELTVPTQTKLVLKTGDSVDLTKLGIAVTDATDPSPFWTVVSLTDGTDPVTVTDEKTFVPTAAGTYTLTVRGEDNSGNVSEDKTVTLALSVFDVTDAAQKAAYYTELFKFDSSSSLGLAIAWPDNFPPEMVADTDATGGMALQSWFMTGKEATGNLRIDLGGLYTVGEIESITVRFRLVKQLLTPEATVEPSLSLYLNNNISQNANVSHIGWKNGADANAQYVDLTVTGQTMLDRNIPATERLDSLLFWTSDYTNNGRIRIDGISIALKPTAAEYNEWLKFESAESLRLTVATKAEYECAIVDDSTATGGKALKSKLFDAGTHGALRIDLGGIYTVSQIEKITIRMKWEKAGNGDLRVYLNGNTTQNGNVSHIAYSGGETAWAEKVVNRQAQLLDRNIPADEKLEYLQFIGSQWDTRGTLWIDSITITLKA